MNKHWISITCYGNIRLPKDKGVKTMTKNELNEIIDACFIHLNAMKHHYTKKRQFELDVIEQGNLDQINDLLDDITGGIERGGFTELEVRYIYDDTEGLWTDVSTDFRKVIF
ncbi:hypothetical protein [Streptococcus agalactiae]